MGPDTMVKITAVVKPQPTASSARPTNRWRLREDMTPSRGNAHMGRPFGYLVCPQSRVGQSLPDIRQWVNQEAELLQRRQAERVARSMAIERSAARGIEKYRRRHTKMKAKLHEAKKLMNEALKMAENEHEAANKLHAVVM